MTPEDIAKACFKGLAFIQNGDGTITIGEAPKKLVNITEQRQRFNQFTLNLRRRRR